MRRSLARVRPRRHADMPAATWRLWAVLTVLVGAGLSWGVSLSADTPTIVVRSVLGGVFGLAIGMYVVERLWERRSGRLVSDTRRPEDVACSGSATGRDAAGDGPGPSTRRGAVP